MARRSKRPASRGSVNNIILKVLSTKDMYGYDIIKEVENATDGKVVLKQPSLYSSLSRFETKGFVTSYWEDSAIGGRRHYYSLTPTGREYYENVVNKSKSSSDNVEEDEDENVYIDENEDENSNEQPEAEEYEIDNEEQTPSYNDYKFDLKNEVDKLLETDEANNIEADDKNTKELETIIQTTDRSNIKPVAYKKIIKPSSNEPQETQEEIIENEPENEDIFNEDKNQQNIDNIKTAREQLNEIYNSIVKNKNKNSQANNELFPKSESPKHTPLTLLEQQKRKESMEILYGNKDSIVKPSEILPKQKLYQQEEKENKNVIETNDYKKLIEIVDKKNLENENKIPEPVKPAEPVKSKKKFVVDEFGIMKIAEDVPAKKEQKIFDNVGYRTNNTGHNVIEYKEPINKSPAQTEAEIKNIKEQSEFNFDQVSLSNEMTDEERAERQKRFNERFEHLQQEKIEQRKNDNVDLKNILGDLYYDEETENDKPHSTFHNRNARLFSDVQRSDEETDLEANVDEAEDVKPERVVSNPQIKLEDNSILNIQKELINKGVEFNTYSSRVKTKDTDFYLVNKLKMALGFILMALMIVETTVFLVLSEKYLPQLENNKSIFIIAYVLSIFIPLLMILPCIFSPNKRKLNNFRLSYSFLFGVFAFILICILTYAINTLLGFTLENIEYYLTSLLIPAILSLNFIIMPFFYKLLLNSKRFY